MKDMSYMFAGIKNIHKIIFYFSNNNIINTSHMFERCKISDSLYFEFFNTENVTDMLYMFQGFNSKYHLSFDVILYTAI
jgi:hypothetical protein